ncbi:MAG TPA: hypothetical protein VHK91_03505 [Flavisolibacter sp.]|jgi:hypothetical protein|nr:hypothetical protein [Flavisolibacter sp.]
MENIIISNLNNPGQLERLYREDKTAFKQAFQSVYPSYESNPLMGFWKERLNFSDKEVSWGTAQDVLVVIIASLIAGFLAKLPAILGIDEEFFYTRNAGFLVFPFLTAWFAWKNQVKPIKLLILAGTSLAGLFFINSLPVSHHSDTLLLSCLHLLIVQWGLLAFAFTGSGQAVEKRMDFLKFNGDLVVITTLILLAAAILSLLTIGLFSLIGYRIETFFITNIVLFGLPAAPIFGNFLIQQNPGLVGKVSPVIAKLFSPLVLMMLVIYLGAMAYSGKDPYNDREFLLVFNALLVGVMAILFFSVAESFKKGKMGWEVWILLLLSLVTIVVNSIALSAILFRISSWGLTPNRIAVLGSNVIILINLLLVTVQLTKVILKKSERQQVGLVIAKYLPVYLIWAALVTFVLPFLFGFK